MPGTSKLRRRVCLAGTAVAIAFPLAGCDKPAVTPSATQSSHDSAWIESAVAQVGTQAGHDPVVRVEIDPTGTTVTTRHPDSQVQRLWRVTLGEGGATPGSTLSPAPSATPRPSASRASGTPGASSTASATASPSARASSTSSRPTSSESARSSTRPRPTPVFVTPSGAPATPLTRPVRVDNTLGNMGLGAFGDTQVLPMWTQLQAHHCDAGSWRMELTSGWSGLVINHAQCGTRRFVQVNGQQLPTVRAVDARLDQQIDMLSSLLPGPVSRLAVTRTSGRPCATELTADYRVELGGPVNLRTTFSCDDITTQELGSGWLPTGTFTVTTVHARQVSSVFRDLTVRRHPAKALVVQQSQLYGAPVMVPATSTNGRPAYGLDGVLKK